MPASDNFTVTFRGVRGTMPVSHSGFMRYGGNTSCVEVRCGERLMILDAGTGIRQVPQTDVMDADILLSHTHIDHILGLPFFTPLFRQESRLRLWAGHLLPQMRLADAISRLMSPPLFPLGLADIKATVEWHDFTAGELLEDKSFAPWDITVHTLPLFHPDRATGYRISYRGHSLSYLTDMEHVPGVMDPEVVRFIRGSDLLIYDSTYDDRNFVEYTGWGHSTWQQAVRYADAAAIGTLALFHHDHMADDKLLDARATALKEMRPWWIVASEGLTISF
jgi:phosphoribosyl 1,2-cyclic phosphodiesterase